MSKKEKLKEGITKDNHSLTVYVANPKKKKK